MMAEKLKVRRIGTSLGVTIPKSLLDKMSIREGDLLTATTDGKELKLSLSDPEMDEWLKVYDRVKERHYESLRELADR